MMRAYYSRRYPHAPTSAVPKNLVENMIEVSHHAFPLYVTVPLLTDWFQVKGWSMACTDIESCGGPTSTVRMPELALVMGPMVVPQPESALTQNSCEVCQGRN